MDSAETRIAKLAEDIVFEKLVDQVKRDVAADVARCVTSCIDKFLEVRDQQIAVLT